MRVKYTLLGVALVQLVSGFILSYAPYVFWPILLLALILGVQGLFLGVVGIAFPEEKTERAIY